MAASAYSQAYNQLGAAYNPQTSLINTQIAQLDPQQQAQQSALDQAKVNAFRDITNSANAKGVLFSGVPIDQQAQYVGTKYLPAVADLKSTFQNSKNSLLGQLNTLNAQRVTQAQNSVADQAKAKSDAAYKTAQLQLGYARLNSSNANAAASRALRGSSTKPTAAEQSKAQQTSFNKQLQSLFNGYDPHNAAHNYYTEKVVIPQLIKQYSYNPSTISKQVYAYRNAVFGE